MSGKRTMRMETQKAPSAGSGGGGFDPSTWGGQARILARNEADAMALLVLAGLIVASAAAIGLSLWAGWAELRDVLSGDGLLALLLMGALVAMVWVVTYAMALRADTDQVRAATWRQELAAGEDLDGDGWVGDPTRGLRVTRGDTTEEIELDLPARSAMGAPVIPAWGVSLPDLMAVLFEADLVRGLQERAWVPSKDRPEVEAFVLPSGQKLTVGMFRQVLGELGKRGWAEKLNGRWELAILPEQVAQALKGSPSPAGEVREGAFSREGAQHAHAQHARVNGSAVKS